MVRRIAVAVRVNMHGIRTFEALKLSTSPNPNHHFQVFCRHALSNLGREAAQRMANSVDSIKEA